MTRAEELAEKVRGYWGPNQAPQLVMAPVLELVADAEALADEVEKLQAAYALIAPPAPDKIGAGASVPEDQHARPDSDAEALAEALEPLVEAVETMREDYGGRTRNAKEDAVYAVVDAAREALARYRGEK